MLRSPRIQEMQSGGLLTESYPLLHSKVAAGPEQHAVLSQNQNSNNLLTCRVNIGWGNVLHLGPGVAIASTFITIGITQN